MSKAIGNRVLTAAAEAARKRKRRKELARKFAELRRRVRELGR
jgi:hypothetical protein